MSIRRISKQAAYAMADVNTDSIGVTYFPYPETTSKVAYSAGSRCTAVLRRGDVSGVLYVSGPYANDYAGARIGRDLGNRERAVVERLSHVEVVERDDIHGRSIVAFVARDSSRFTVATFDFGRTWTICG